MYKLQKSYNKWNIESYNTHISNIWQYLQSIKAGFFVYYLILILFIKNLLTLIRIKIPGSIRGAFNRFPDFFVQAFKIVIDSWKVQYVIVIHRMRWLTNSYDFRFQCTATSAIGIHPTKAWLSQLVNFKNAIWHFRRTRCNKILF